MVQPALIPMTLTLVLAPQLLGGVFPWSAALICALAGIAGALTSRHVEIISQRRRAATLLDWMMVAALAWTGLQLLPLPMGWVALLMPESADAWQANALLFGESQGSWIPMSLDPGATRLEVAKGAAIVAMFLVARVFAASHQRRRVLKAVAASAIAMALVAFAHKLAGATHVFGIYEPVYASSRLLAPLMNENHLGGFMALTAPIAVGLAIDTDSLEERLGWAVGASVCALAGVLSFSRGGILALTIGVSLFIVLYATRLKQSDRSLVKSRTVPLLAIGGLVIVLVVLVVQGSSLARELSNRHNIAPKFEGAVAALPVIASHPIAGVGRGAFAAAFVGQRGTEKRFFYPENLPVQWASEWGIPLAFALLWVVIWSIGRGFKLRRSHAQLGALCGLVAIGTHQLADFSLESSGSRSSARPRWAPSQIRFRSDSIIHCAGFADWISNLSLLGAALALSLHGGDVFTLEMKSRAALEQGNEEAARELSRRGLSLHPSEPIFALTGAEVSIRERDGSAGRWINRAQSLAPLWSTPHLLAARWLYDLGQRDQALVEIRRSRGAQTRERANDDLFLAPGQRGPSNRFAGSAGGSGGSIVSRPRCALPSPSVFHRNSHRCGRAGD